LQKRAYKGSLGCQVAHGTLLPAVRIITRGQYVQIPRRQTHRIALNQSVSTVVIFPMLLPLMLPTRNPNHPRHPAQHPHFSSFSSKCLSPMPSSLTCYTGYRCDGRERNVRCRQTCTGRVVVRHWCAGCVGDVDDDYIWGGRWRGRDRHGVVGTV
jgi:hypothetical protein